MIIIDWLRKFRNAFRVEKIRLRGVKLGPHGNYASSIVTRRGFSTRGKGSICAGSFNTWEQGVILDAFGGSIALGSHVHLGPYTVIYGHGNVTIGDHALIGPRCSILSSNHTIPAREALIATQPDVKLSTHLGRDVWLGAGVTVLGGITLGDGCVVGAGAVVTKDLPPGAIAVGVPARVIDYRPTGP